MRRRDVMRAGLVGGVVAIAGPVGQRVRAATERHPSGLAGASGSGAGASGSGADPYEPLGTLAMEYATEAVVDASGETAYVATGDGFAVIDVTEPADPSLLAAVTEPRIRGQGVLPQIDDLALDGDRLAIAGPSGSSEVKGIVIYDVGDPAAPERVGTHEAVAGVHNVAFADGYVYYTANDGDANPMRIVDAAEPADIAGFWSLSYYHYTWTDVHPALRALHDITIENSRAYLSMWDAGVWVLDLSDPTDPAYLTHFGGFPRQQLEEMRAAGEVRGQYYQPPGNAHYALPNDDGSMVAVGAEAWDHELGDGVGGPGGVTLWDVTDPHYPRVVEVIDPPRSPSPTTEGVYTTAHNFDWVGDRLYTAWYRGGVKIHDVSDPREPELLAWWREPDRASFWTAKKAPGRDFFVASSRTKEAVPTSAGLYTFPDRAGTQPEPGLLTRTPTPTPTASPTPSPSPTPTTSPTGTAGSGDGAAPGESGGSRSFVPGFGWLGAGVGLALGAWRAVAKAGGTRPEPSDDRAGPGR